MNAASSSPPTGPPSDAPPESGLPRTFGAYTLFEHIGKGGMAEIYLARAETELGATRLAVVKQILPAFADDPRFAEMLIHEAKLAARLGHRRIVQVFDLGKHDGTSVAAEQQLYIAMEYVEGFDLNSLLRHCTEQRVPLPAPHALGIVADVLEGLDYAHRRTGDDDQPLGIVHRDVSPSNVLISYEGEVKLCDFGIAHANDVVKNEANEALKGKAGYMSPEHARGEALDARADVFAAGIILWELLAGRRLYKPKSDLPLVEQAQRAEIPALPDKGVPRHAELEKIVRRALAKDREDRYPSAAALLRDLETFLADTGMLASRLELGKWIATSFGTDLIDKRRASERRLPKSQPPPRSSERMRAGAPVPASAPIPAAPRIPREARDPSTLPVSDGAMRAFKKELESGNRMSFEPSSLAGSAMDVEPSSSSQALEPAATGRASSSDAEAESLRATTSVALPAKPGRPLGTLVLWAIVIVIAAALVALARFFGQ